MPDDGVKVTPLEVAGMRTVSP